MTTERERQAAAIGACWWVVRTTDAFKDAVGILQYRAASERGALRVAEAEYPGVPFVSASPGFIRSSDRSVSAGRVQP